MSLWWIHRYAMNLITMTRPHHRYQRQQLKRRHRRVKSLCAIDILLGKLMEEFYIRKHQAKMEIIRTLNKVEKQSLGQRLHNSRGLTGRRKLSSDCMKSIDVWVTWIKKLVASQALPLGNVILLHLRRRKRIQDLAQSAIRLYKK